MKRENSVEERLRAAYAGVEFRPPVEAIVATARSRRARQGAGLVAACGLLVVIGLVLWSPLGAEPAFGWTPKASAPQPEVAVGITRWCSPPPGSPVAALPPLVVVDQRGQAAVGYFADQDREFLCFLHADGATWTDQGTAGVGGPLDPFVAPLTVDGLARWRGPVHITAVRGRVAPEVAAVTVTRDDGLRVQARVTNGFYVAWWPTDNGFRLVGALDANRHVVAECTPKECR